MAVERDSTSAAEVDAISVWRCGAEVSGLSPSVHGESSVGGFTVWWPESFGRRTRVSCSSSSSSSESDASSLGGDGVEFLDCRSCSTEDDGVDKDVDIAAEVAITVEGAKVRAVAE